MRRCLAITAMMVASLTCLGVQPSPTAHAAGCAVYDGAVLATYDPCPESVPAAVCTVFGQDASCAHWLLFSVDGSTTEIHECAADNFSYAIRARPPSTPAGSGPFCYGPPLPGVGGGEITPARIGMPAGVTALLVNLTMVNGHGQGYITADRCSALVPGPQAKSNGNFTMSSAIANVSVVPIDSDGRFCIYNSVRLDLVADVQGYFAAKDQGGQVFLPASPRRLIDTRLAPLSRPGTGAITRVLTGVASGTSAVLVNLTMVDGAAAGFITADKCSALQGGAQAKSNGNHPVASAIANLSVVPVDADGSFCIYNNAPVNLVVDLQGSFASDGTAGGLGLDFASARRLLDSRSASGATLSEGTVTRVPTGATAGTSAVLVNITMTDGLVGGYITADRCSAIKAGPQTKSNGNHLPVTAIANLSVVPVDADGSFCIYNSAPVNLVVDLQGGLGAAAPLRFYPTSPVRVLDTRISS